MGAKWMVGMGLVAAVAVAITVASHDGYSCDYGEGACCCGVMLVLVMTLKLMIVSRAPWTRGSTDAQGAFTIAVQLPPLFAGLDLMDHMEVFTSDSTTDTSRRAAALRRFIRAYQDSFTAIEKVRVPSRRLAVTAETP